MNVIRIRLGFSKLHRREQLMVEGLSHLSRRIDLGLYQSDAFDSDCEGDNPTIGPDHGHAYHVHNVLFLEYI